MVGVVKGRRESLSTASCSTLESEDKMSNHLSLFKLEACGNVISKTDKLI